MDVRRQLTVCALACALGPAVLLGQRPLVALSEGEVEEIREAAIEPAHRIGIYQQIVDKRISRIQDVLVNQRAQGRAEDIHQAMEDTAGLVNEIEDNLSDYDKTHRDVRKALPKLQDAVVRWESVLKQPPENDAYTLTRKLALEAVADLRNETKEMLESQKRYFKEHPPQKDDPPERETGR